MVQTIYLNEKTGGFEFDSNGRLKLIGEPNRISLEEVRQRTSIRFRTQKGLNILHPNEGFDFWLLLGINKSIDNNYNIAREILIEQEIRATLQQDPDILQGDYEIFVRQLSNRSYEAIVRYGIRGEFEKRLEFIGNISAL